MSRRLRLVDRPTKPVPAPVVVVDPEIVKEALRAAGGDRRRLKILPDGSVLVVNRPR